MLIWGFTYNTLWRGRQKQIYSSKWFLTVNWHHKRDTIQVPVTLEGLLQILRNSRKDVLHSVMYFYLHEWIEKHWSGIDSLRSWANFLQTSFLLHTSYTHRGLRCSCCGRTINKTGTQAVFINITTESTVCPPSNLPVTSLFHLCHPCLLICSVLTGSPTVVLWKSFDVPVASVQAFLDLLPCHLLLVKLHFHPRPSHHKCTPTHTHMEQILWDILYR